MRKVIFGKVDKNEEKQEYDFKKFTEYISFNNADLLNIIAVLMQISVLKFGFCFVIITSVIGYAM